MAVLDLIRHQNPDLKINREAIQQILVTCRECLVGELSHTNSMTSLRSTG
jgi:hypothetical protein